MMALVRLTRQTAVEHAEGLMNNNNKDTAAQPNQHQNQELTEESCNICIA